MPPRKQSQKPPSSDHGPPEASEESKKKPEKVMVPFFADGEPDLVLPSKSSKPRRTRNKPESNVYRNRSFYTKNSPPTSSTKEVGLTSEPLKSNLPGSHAHSYPFFKVSDKITAAEFEEENQKNKVVYISKSNVGNIRPLEDLYFNQPSPTQENEPSQSPFDSLRESFRPQLAYSISPPVEPHQEFVDALIRNSNSFEDFQPPPTRKSDKSQELKSVLTKMGILEISSLKDDHELKTLNEDLDKHLEKDLQKDNGKHYVFPKYMSSPDPSSIPIPGSL